MAVPKKSDDIDFPENVVNKVAYRNYLKLEKEPILNEGRYIYSKEAPDLRIDLLTPFGKLNEKLEDFTHEEAERIRTLAKKALSRRAKKFQQRNKAYGVKSNGGKSFSESYLDPKKAELVDLFGQMYTIQEVIKIVNRQWKIPVKIDTLKRFRNKYIDQIKERQEVHQRDYTSVRLVHKKSRLLELSQLFSSRKEIYNITQSPVDYKLLLQTLNDIRREVEGDKVTVDGNIDININATIDLHLHKELLNKIPIIDIVIARIAGKQGINPMYLLSRLHHSAYKKFNGFGEVDGEIEDAEIEYPSSETFDPEYVKKRQELLAKQKALLQTIPSNPEMKNTAADIKEMLLKRVAKNKAQVSNSQDKIDKAT